MPECEKIKSVSDLIQILKDKKIRFRNSEAWYRGQSDAEWGAVS